MNKQEAIDELENAIPDFILNDFQRGKETGLTYALELVEQLNDPEKPVVPQFVADWYEEHAGTDFEYNLYLLYIDYYEQKLEGNLKEWIAKGSKNKAIQTLVNMHQFGYEVEEEKLYTVEIPNPNGSGYSKTYLCKNEDDKVELFTWSHYTSIEYADNWKQLEPAQLTESEIKQDFEWAWQFAKEVDE